MGQIDDLGKAVGHMTMSSSSLHEKTRDDEPDSLNDTSGCDETPQDDVMEPGDDIPEKDISMVRHFAGCSRSDAINALTASGKSVHGAVAFLNGQSKVIMSTYFHSKCFLLQMSI